MADVSKKITIFLDVEDMGYRWLLRYETGVVMEASPVSYPSREDCERAVAGLVERYPDARVVDLTPQDD